MGAYHYGTRHHFACTSSAPYSTGWWLGQLSTNIFCGFVHTVIIAVFYRYGEQTAGASSGMSMAQAVSYVWLGQIVLYLLPRSVVMPRSGRRSEMGMWG